MGFWEQLAAALGLGTAGLAVLAWLIRSLINHFLSKDIETYKDKLKLESEKETETLKVSLQQVAYEHEVRFGRLHEERANIIRTLYEKTIDVEEKLRNLYYKYRPVGMNPPDVNENDVLDSVREFRSMCDKSRIYFSTELASLLDVLCQKLGAAWGSLEWPIMLTNEDEPPQFEETQFLEITDQIPAVKEKLEQEFRKILGVQ